MARPIKEDFQLIEGVFYCTIKVASQMCGVSTQSVRQYRDRPNAPPYDEKLGLYPVPGLGEWIRTEQIYRQGIGGKYPYKPDMSRYGDSKADKSPTVTMMPGQTPPREDIKESHADRYDRLKADKLELELNAKAETFVLADEVLLAMTSMVSNVKTRLLAIPSQIADTLSQMSDPVKVQEFMEDEMYVALEGLTPDWTKEIDFDANDEEDEEDE